MLDVSPQSVKSALQRARATLDERMPKLERAPLPDSPAERELIARFSDAVEAGDSARIVALLTDEALLAMPPLPLVYVGHQPIARFLDNRTEVRGAPLQLRPTRANGQPGFGSYLHSRAWGMLALTLSGGQISRAHVLLRPVPTQPLRAAPPDLTGPHRGRRPRAVIWFWA